MSAIGVRADILVCVQKLPLGTLIQDLSAAANIGNNRRKRRTGSHGLLIYLLLLIYFRRSAPLRRRLFVFDAQSVRAIEQILLFTTPLATSPQ